MSGILEVLVQNILPIFLVASLGYWLRRTYKLDPKPLATVVFNGFSPALVFSSLVSTQLPLEELAQLASFALVTILALGVVSVLGGRLLGFNRREIVVLALVVMFANTGNYGLTLNQIRYGNAGLSRAVVFYAVSSILIYTLGVFLVSMGRMNWRAALARLTRVPAVYAVALAVIVYSAQIPIPAPLMQAIDLAAAGAIPAMIVILGMNIAGLQGFTTLRFTLPAASLRLVGGALVAALVASLIGLNGLGRSISIIEASTPTAVLTTVLATEFDAEPAAVTSVVVLSTLASPITLALVINLLRL
jgi:predicted permease